MGISLVYNYILLKNLRLNIKIGQNKFFLNKKTIKQSEKVDL